VPRPLARFEPNSSMLAPLALFFSAAAFASEVQGAYIDPVIVSNSPGEWSVAQVGKFLGDLGLGQYAETFETNAIDGAVLVSLTSDELASDLGITKLGHRKRILTTVKDLNQKYPVDDGSRVFHLDAGLTNPDGHEYTPGEKGARGFNDDIQWLNSIPEGLRVAAETEKPVLLLVHNTACHQCQKLKKAFTTSPYTEDIVRLSKDFVMVNLQNEEEPAEDKYSPDGAYIPRMIFMDHTGKVETSIINTKGSKGFDYFYYRAKDVKREMERARAAFASGGEQLRPSENTASSSNTCKNSDGSNDTASSSRTCGTSTASANRAGPSPAA